MLSLELMLMKYPQWWRGEKIQSQKNPAIPCYAHVIHCKNQVIQRIVRLTLALIIHRITSTDCAWDFFNNTVQNKHFPFRLSFGKFWYLTNIYAEALKDFFMARN